MLFLLDHILIDITFGCSLGSTTGSKRYSSVLLSIPIRPRLDPAIKMSLVVFERLTLMMSYGGAQTAKCFTVFDLQ